MDTYTHSDKLHTSNTRAIIARTLTTFVAACLIMYTVLMVQTISLINERKDIRESIRQSQIKISDLEVHYFDLAQSIDTKTIIDMGFTESTIPVFAYTHPNYATVAISD